MVRQIFYPCLAAFSEVNFVLLKKQNSILPGDPVSIVWVLDAYILQSLSLVDGVKLSF